MVPLPRVGAERSNRRRGFRRYCVAWGVLSLLLVARPASAEPPWHMALGGGSHVPIDLHLRLDFEGPGGILFSGAVGYLPRAYVDTLNELAVSYDWYDERTSELISAALQDAVVWRAQAGWKPSKASGFYLLGGYQLVTLGGGLAGAEVVAIVTGRELNDAEASRISLNAESTLHMLDFELGWRWTLVEGLQLGAGLGAFFTVDASTQLRTEGTRPVLQERLEPLLRDGERYLNDVYTSYVHSPRLSLTLTYRLF